MLDRTYSYPATDNSANLIDGSPGPRTLTGFTVASDTIADNMFSLSGNVITFFSASKSSEYSAIMATSVQH
jgi:hypothetical protein